MKQMSIVLLLVHVVFVGGCSAIVGAFSGTNRPVENISMKPTPLEFEIDRRFWAEGNLDSGDATDVLAMRAFSRRMATPDSECPGAMVVVAESVPAELDVLAYSAAKRSGMPPHTIEKVFSRADGTLQLKNAVGYRIRGSLKCHPVVHVVHARDAAVGYTIVLEVDPRDYAAIETEVRSILKSFHIGRA